MWTVYTKQFESDVWGIIILVSVSIVLCLHCVSRCSSEVHISLPDSAFIITGIIFGQGKIVKKKRNQTLLLICIKNDMNNHDINTQKISTLYC